MPEEWRWRCKRDGGNRSSLFVVCCVVLMVFGIRAGGRSSQIKEEWADGVRKGRF